MDAEAILQYDTMNLSNEQCATLRGDLARTLGEAAHAYGVEVELGFHAVPMGGVYAREAVIKGSEKDVLEATKYIVDKNEQYGLPIPSVIDPLHPVASWRGFRLASYVVGSERGDEALLDVAYAMKDPTEAQLAEAKAIAGELASRYGVSAEAGEDVQAYGGGPMMPPVISHEGIRFTLEGEMGSVEGALRDLKGRYDATPTYGTDVLHPVRSFRGGNIAKAVELEE